MSRCTTQAGCTTTASKVLSSTPAKTAVSRLNSRWAQATLSKVGTKACKAWRLQGKVGVLTTGSERIDASCWPPRPQLRVVANMAVGYNNFDVPGLHGRRRAGHQHARRADRDHGRLRLCADDGHRAPHGRERTLPARGEWNRWAYDMFTGSDVHGATLGILGMGRIGQAIARRGRTGLWHAGDLSQPQPPAARAGSPLRPLRQTRPRCCPGRPPGAGAALHAASHHAIGAPSWRR
jgi:lactate dehydrogenase-like 2-hydroxyacid dehydrogenase